MKMIVLHSLKVKTAAVRRFLSKFASKVFAVALAVLPILYGGTAMATGLQPSQGGGDIGNSAFAKGLAKLLNDVAGWLIVIGPIVMGVLMIYFFIRRGMADEHEQKQWNKRIVSALVCGAMVVGAAALVTIFSGYFK